jgi:hypothetical protein
VSNQIGYQADTSYAFGSQRSRRVREEGRLVPGTGTEETQIQIQIQLDNTKTHTLYVPLKA